MALSGNEKDFLARFARSDSPADHIAAYRECKCAGHDKTDATIKGYIEALVEREDAGGYLRQQEARRNLQRMLAQREIDKAEAEVTITAAKARQIALEALTEAAMHERDALALDPEKSLQGLSRACDSIERLTRNGMGDEEGLSEAEAQRMWAEEQRALGKAAPLIDNPIGSA